MTWLIAYFPCEVRIQRALPGVLDGDGVVSDVGGIELGEQNCVSCDSDVLYVFAVSRNELSSSSEISVSVNSSSDDVHSVDPK